MVSVQTGPGREALCAPHTVSCEMEKGKAELSSASAPDVITPVHCGDPRGRLSGSHLHSHVSCPTNLHSIRLMLPKHPFHHDIAWVK